MIVGNYLAGLCQVNAGSDILSRVDDVYIGAAGGSSSDKVPGGYSVEESCVSCLGSCRSNRLRMSGACECPGFTIGQIPVNVNVNR